MNSSSWQSVPLLSCVDEIIDFRGKTPKKIGMEWGNGSIKALSANNVKQGYIDFKRECYLASEELYEAWMTKGDCSKDDIVFTMEAPLGNVALIPDDSKYILSQRVILLKPNKLVDSKYLFHFMSSDSFQNELNANATGSTAKGIKQTRLVKLKVTLPPLLEQQKIAEILSTVDEKIDLINQKIAKTEKFKTGLMQKLFSEGVGVQDSDGNWQPHSEFQDSPFGKIPKCWQKLSLESIASVERGKFSARPRNDPKYFGGETPFVQTGDVVNAHVYIESYSQTLNELGLTVSKTFPPETVLITIAANIGDVAITKFPLACPDSLVGIQANKDICNASWLFFFMQTQKSELDSRATKSAQKNINLQVLKPLSVFLPPLQEQEFMVEILLTSEQKLALLKQQKAETQQLKQGLMQKLLTGEWRVPLDNPETA
ncbi:TPA: restriction endonuclease subunit S [Vibrio vulnificus]|nr:restriction endonuclease subunit S [Vibrio vulnificus]